MSQQALWLPMKQFTETMNLDQLNLVSCHWFKLFESDPKTFILVIFKYNIILEYSFLMTINTVPFVEPSLRHVSIEIHYNVYMTLFIKMCSVVSEVMFKTRV